MKNLFLVISESFFDLFGTMHLVRFFLRWPVTVGSVSIPLTLSLVVGIVALGLGSGCFLAFAIRERG